MTPTLTPSHMAERALNDYGFENWKRVSGEMKIKNPFNMFSDIAFALICKKHRRRERAGGRILLATSMIITRLIDEHKIPQIRELVDDNDRHLHA